MRPHRWQPTRLPHPWDSPGKNTVVGCHSLLQGIFPTEGWNPGLLLCRQILYCLSHLESLVNNCESESHSVMSKSLRILQARILEWVAVPLSRGSSQLRDWMQVCISALPVESPGKSKCWETCTVRNLLMFPLQWKTAVTSWFSSGLKTKSKLQYHDFWPSKFSQKGNYYTGSITNTARFVNTVKGWLHI